MATEPRATTFVTRAAGFIGSELLKVLVALGHRVFSLTDSLETTSSHEVATVQTGRRGRVNLRAKPCVTL